MNQIAHFSGCPWNTTFTALPFNGSPECPLEEGNPRRRELGLVFCIIGKGNCGNHTPRVEVVASVEKCH